MNNAEDGPRLDVTVITTTDELAALRVDWLELWQRDPHATPFRSPAWLLPWWEAFGTGELLAFAARTDGRLVGLVPLYVLHEAQGRKLLPLGIGITDWLDPLTEPRHAARIATAVLACLPAFADRFDWCDLEGLREGSPWLSAPLPAGWSGDVHANEPCPVLALPASGELLAQSVPKLASVDYLLRRAAKLGPTAFEAATAANVDELVDALFELHTRRWQRRGESGVLSDRHVRSFHRRTAPGLLALGLLRLYGLRIADRIAAVFYGLADRRRHFNYIGGFDPDLSHPGLGRLMIGHAIRQAVREGARELDFLKGREPYKYGWGAVDRARYGRRLKPG